MSLALQVTTWKSDSMLSAYKDHDDPSECVSITDLNRALVFVSYMYFIVKQTCIWFFIWRSSSIPCFHSLFWILSEMLKVSLVLVWEVSNSTWSKNRSFCVLSLERWNLRRPACLSNLTVRSILPYCKCPYRQQKNKRTEELIKLSILELRWVFCVCFCPGFCLSGYIQVCLTSSVKLLRSMSVSQVCFLKESPWSYLKSHIHIEFTKVMNIYSCLPSAVISTAYLVPICVNLINLIINELLGNTVRKRWEY